jgi:hypothetical protein
MWSGFLTRQATLTLKQRAGHAEGCETAFRVQDAGLCEFGKDSLSQTSAAIRIPAPIGPKTGTGRKIEPVATLL